MSFEMLSRNFSREQEIIRDIAGLRPGQMHPVLGRVGYC